MANKPRLYLRLRFSLWALLVLITVIAIPLSYVAQRRAWNLRRMRTIEELGESKFDFRFAKVDGAFVAPRKGTLQIWWDQLCRNDDIFQVEEILSYPRAHAGEDQGTDFITDNDLQRLRDFPEIQSIYFFDEPQITDDGLAVLSCFPKLSHLQLHNLPNCTGCFARDISSDNVLQVIWLSKLNKLQGAELDFVSTSKRLECLLLEDCLALTDANVKNVDLPVGVKYLRIASDGIGDQTLARSLANTKLEYLDIECPVTKTILPSLARQTKLKTLCIANTSLVDDDFSFLANYEHLETLRICAMPIRGGFLSKIGQPDNLHHLDLSATLLADEHLTELRRFENLHGLYLRWTPICGEGLVGLSKLDRVSEVSLRGTRFSEKGKMVLGGLSGPSRITMPANWTAADNARFPSGFGIYERLTAGDFMDFEERPTFWPMGIWTVEAEPKSAQLVQLSNTPKDLMGPVIRLLEDAKEKEAK